MTRWFVAAMVLALVAGVGTPEVGALTGVTPIGLSETVPFCGDDMTCPDVWEVKCLSGALSLRVAVSDTGSDGDIFQVLLTGLAPGALYGQTRFDTAQGSNPGLVQLNRSSPGRIKALVHVAKTHSVAADGAYGIELRCLGVGGVPRLGSILLKQDVP